MSDSLELAAMHAHFTSLNLPCPSRHCDAHLTEYDQHSRTPYKAFLVCPKCESRLRIWQTQKFNPRPGN